MRNTPSPSEVRRAESGSSTARGTISFSPPEYRDRTPTIPRRPKRLVAFLAQSRVLLALVFGTLAGVVTAVAAATGILYDWFPDLRRDPETQTAAALRVLAMEPGATEARYRRLAGLPANDSTATVYLFFVEIEAKGMKRREGVLAWCLLRKETGTRTPGYGCRGLRPTPGTTNDRFVVPVWYQPPLDPGRYFLRFTYRAKGALLAIADSPPFGPCRPTSCR